MKFRLDGSLFTHLFQKYRRIRIGYAQAAAPLLAFFRGLVTERSDNIAKLKGTPQLRHDTRTLRMPADDVYVFLAGWGVDDDVTVL